MRWKHDPMAYSSFNLESLKLDHFATYAQILV